MIVKLGLTLRGCSFSFDFSSWEESLLGHANKVQNEL